MLLHYSLLKTGKTEWGKDAYKYSLCCWEQFEQKQRDKGTRMASQPRALVTNIRNQTVEDFECHEFGPACVTA